MLDDFYIQEVKMPTEAGLKRASDAWFEKLNGTCLDQLPEPILELGPKTHFLEFDAADLMKMFDGDMTEAGRLAADADKITKWDPHFFRLSTRSAKDAMEGGGLTVSGRQALFWMSGSMRIAEDLQNLKWLEAYCAKLCIREPFWGLEGLGTWEFRCFVRRGDLIAVSDYDYLSPNPRLRDRDIRFSVYSEIEEFFYGKMQPNMDMPDFVFDLAKTSEGWILIEVNPYGLSDPCFLQDYAGVESFRGDIAIEFSAPVLEVDG